MPDEERRDRIVINAEDLAGAAETPGRKLVISKEDLAGEAPLAPAAPVAPAPAAERAPAPRRRWRMTFRSRVGLAVTAGSVSAFIAWAVSEPFRGLVAGTHWADVVLFGVMAGCLGFGLGALEGLRSRNWRRALQGGGIAFAIGAGSTLAITGVSAPWVQQVTAATNGVTAQHVLVRALGWAALGALAGLAQGIPFGSRWKVGRGVMGGLAGGALAGLTFDPLAFWTGAAWVSRLVGLTLTGALTGLGVGLSAEWRRPAWLVVTRGPLTGCEFVLHRATFVIGRSPTCDAPLMGDRAVGECHTAIRARPGGFYVEDQGSPSGTFVNGVLVRRQRLANADSIRVGQTLFVYHERDLTPAGVSYTGAVGTP